MFLMEFRQIFVLQSHTSYLQKPRYKTCSALEVQKKLVAQSQKPLYKESLTHTTIQIKHIFVCPNCAKLWFCTNNLDKNIGGPSLTRKYEARIPKSESPENIKPEFSRYGRPEN